MNTKVYEFNSVVENIKSIIREARHMPGISNKRFEPELIKFQLFMDNVNFKVSFVNDPEYYLQRKMLDVMDCIKYNLMAQEQNKKVLAVYNSIYDVINEWYFD